MKIYTKAGDAGETGLFGGARISKTSPRIEAYGTLDELNATLGMVVTDRQFPADLSTKFQRIQNELFRLGAELATPPEKRVATKLIGNAEVTLLENEIDLMETELSPLKTFILPGGAPAAAVVHLCRTVCRRAERQVVALNELEKVRSEVLQYLNRLSDFLFVASRLTNHRLGLEDVPWLNE